MSCEEKRNKWRELIKEYDISKENRKTWCTRMKINKNTFNYWYARLGTEINSKVEVTKSADESLNKNIESDKLSTSGWVEVQIQPENGQENKSKNEIFKKEEISNTSQLIVVKIGKAEINIEAGFDKCIFKDVAKILGEIC